MTEADSPAPEKPATIRRWYQDTNNVSIGVAVVALIVSGVSAYKSISQTSEQSKINQQQELLTLVSDVAKEPATISEDTITFRGNEAALHQAEVGTQLSELAESEEAASIIKLLHGSGVTPIEYYETGIGLLAANSDAEALTFLARSDGPDADPHTRADALREEASIYYRLGQVTTAEHKDALAIRAYDGVPDVTRDARQNNIAFTELWDASLQAKISCATARSEVAAAEVILASDPGAGTPTVEREETSDRNAVARCRAGRLQRQDRPSS